MSSKIPFMPMIPVALRNLLSRPATRRYPFEKRQPFTGSRGHVEVDIETCVFCGLCARKCPTVAISVSREHKTFALERMRCISCGICVDTCNKDSLRMELEPQPVFAATDQKTEGKPLGSWEKVQPPKPVETPASDPVKSV